MDDSPLYLDKVRKRLADRLLALFEILLLSGVLSSAIAVSLLPGKSLDLLTKDAKTVCFFLLLEAGITILLLILVITTHRETSFSLGLHWYQWKSNILIGLSLVPFLFLINMIVALAFRFYLPRYYIEKNPLTEIIQTPSQLALFIISALVAGGIKEELQRAFILNRFGRYLGGAGLGLILWSLVFGAGHYVQGWQGIVITTICGFVFGVTYLLRKSLIGPIVAHSIYDILALLTFWFYSNRFK
jgi:uncharacterized protein